uniref:LRRCT domain-containing protein n=1 Tax=Branchiostoma floridae TaxID=7739 RepID=C3ZPQ9_BRAFL|eukprot:XP_002589469.1 hypothetical protein BRAFLDRAFT_80107 [Branchiostoma floridae]
MSGKMKRTMVLLLIMLNEAGPTAAWQDCSSCSSYCYCSSRGLSSVPQDLPTGITGLYLRYNVITTLNQSDFSRYSSLTTLDLRSNRISVINSGAFNNLTSLATLNLNNNQLASIRADMFVGLENLVYLYLHGNNIHSIEAGTFVNLPQLRNLRLNSNQLTSLTADMFKGLDDLDDLYLSHNDISTIEAGALANLTKLRDLNLSHNNISTFPMEAASNLNTSGFIYDLYEWPHLSINDNQMETLPPMAYDILASIRTVNITNNPWQCDCRMLPFKQRMTSFPDFEKQIRCAGPENLAGKSLFYLVDPEDLNCEETGSVDGTSLGGFSLPLFLSSLGGVLVGAFLTSAVYSAAWCKIRRRKTTPNPVKYPRYRYASPRTAPSPELSLSVIDLNAEDTTVV